MADITNLDQIAQPLDRLTSTWINQVSTRIKSLEQQLALANEKIDELRDLVRPFYVSVVSGLNVSVAPGSIKLTTGNVVTLATTALAVPNNATSYIYISSTGVLTVSGTRPPTGREIARVTTNNGLVTELINYPLLEVALAFPDLDDYATIEYANTRAWLEQAFARKTSLFNIPGRDTYYRIPFEALTGNGFNTAGVFSGVGKFVFKAQIRVDTLATATNPDMSAKLSLFASDVGETGVAMQQSASAEGDLILNAENAEPLILTAGKTADLRIYLTRGTQCRVREGSRVQVYKLPG